MTATSDPATQTAPAPPGAVARHRIPGAHHIDDLTLGGSTVRLAVHTGAGIREFRRLMSEDRYERLLGFGPSLNDGLSDADYSARALVGGALALEDYATLAELLTFLLVDPVSEHEVQEASPEELVAVIRSFLGKSGLEWLNRVLKNLAASLTTAGIITLAAATQAQQTGTESENPTSSTALPESGVTPPTSAGSESAGSAPFTVPDGSESPSISGTASSSTSQGRRRTRRTRS